MSLSVLVTSDGIERVFFISIICYYVFYLEGFRLPFFGLGLSVSFDLGICSAFGQSLECDLIFLSIRGLIQKFMDTVII